MRDRFNIGDLLLFNCGELLCMYMGGRSGVFFVVGCGFEFCDHITIQSYSLLSGIEDAA